MADSPSIGMSSRTRLRAKRRSAACRCSAIISPPSRLGRGGAVGGAAPPKSPFAGRATPGQGPQPMPMQASVADRRAAYSIPEDVLAGLTAPQKSIPSKYFHDAEGSRLFESICLLPEYYVARTETALLGQVAKDKAGHLARVSSIFRFVHFAPPGRPKSWKDPAHVRTSDRQVHRPLEDRSAGEG